MEKGTGREGGGAGLGRLSLAAAEGDIVGLPGGACLIGGNCSQRQGMLTEFSCETV